MGFKKVSVDEAYDSPPFWYDIRGLFILWLTYKSSLRKQISFFSQLTPHSIHLEVAIGSGSLFRLVYLWAYLKGCVPKKIIGFDYAPSMLEGAKKVFKNYKKIELQVADATALSYQDNLFDSVNLANAIHCIPDYQKAISEIYRVLKPEGKLLINVLLPPSGFLRSVSDSINAWGIKKGILQSPISEFDLKECLRINNFTISNTFAEGNCLYLSAIKKQS